MVNLGTTTFRRANNRHFAIGQQLGQPGGEGTVYRLAGEPTVVAKIYHQHRPVPVAKLREMLANPPHDPTRHQGHISIAWPTDLAFDAQGAIVGFLMPHIDFSTSGPMLKLYNQQDRLQQAPAFTWQYLLRTATNLASAIAALHARGYVVGDLNESNLLVSNTAMVAVVDCDSMQVPDGNGQVFRCPVGKPEYTPPELQGRDFSTVDRDVTHDNFGLAVLTFMLLMEGVHPFTGVWHGRGNPPTLEENIQTGDCPYAGSNAVTPPPYALSFTTLPPAIQALVAHCFGAGHQTPTARPSAQEWHQALKSAEQQLTHCRANAQHVYSQHLSSCPWCDRVSQGIPDPFPQLGQQVPLPNVPWGAPAPAQPAAPSRPTRARPRPQQPQLASLRCSQCGYINHAHEIFCQGCAAQLKSNKRCRACAGFTPANAYYCVQCGRRP